MIGKTSKLLLGVALMATAVPALAQTRPARAPAATAIAFGQTLNGQLSAGDQCASDPRVRFYRFTAQANARIEVTMCADDFDTLVEVGRLEGCTFTSLGSNDDGGGDEDGLNSRLIGTLREAGTYYIRATSYSEGAAGSFQLALNRLPPLPGTPQPVALRLGDKVDGSLTINDPMIPGDVSDDASIVDSGRPYRLYALTGTAGQEYVIRLESSDFDPYLEIGTLTPLGYSVAASNDDGGEEDDGLNSRLKVRFESDGTMLIRVSPLGSDTGAYSLSAEVAKAE